MKDKEKLRQQLLEETLGKNAKNRSLSSISDDLEDILRKQQDSLSELKSQVDEKTLQKLNEEMKKDFGMSFLENDNLDDLKKIEEELNQKYHYDSTSHDLVTFIKKAKVIEKEEYSLLLYNCKDIKEYIEDYIHELFQYHYIKSNEISYVSFHNYPQKEDIFYNDMYSCLYSSSQFIVLDYIDELPITLLPYMISLLKDKEIKLSNRYIEQNGTLKETTNQLMKETVHTLKLNDKYIILLSHVSLDKLSEKLGLPFIKAIDEKKEFINISKENKNIFIENSFHEFKEKMNKQLDIQLSEGLLEYLLNESVGDVNGFLDDVFERLFDFKEKYSSDIDIVYKDHDLYVCDELLFSKENIGFEDIDQQLHNLVGLEEVKQSLEDLKQYYKIVQIRKKQGKKTTDVNKHMIFTGNPGTGKTTVARILSKYLKAANILESGHLIEVTRKDLVGQYVGHTAKLTHQVITSALGGVLFIDEAYSLYRGNNDSYGLEAIDTLVKAMEDHRDEFVVILAGYDKEMDTFLQSNSGLRSRFTNIIHFSDYSGEDLYKIACQIASSHDYTIDESCKDELISYLDKSNKELGGNGRLARNVVEKAMIQNAKRENSDILILEDFDIQKGSE